MSDEQSSQQTLSRELLFKEIYSKVQDNFLGEILGRFLESESKANLFRNDLNEAQEMLKDFGSVKEENANINSLIEQQKTNVLALESQNNELKGQIESLTVDLREVKAERQLLLERIHQLEYPPKKRGRPNKK